ncbi:sulfotransferase family protein [Roseinatronobacter alkalisoli]|uniref:Sulfotransferase n=1 Tax=Roseinatronobacter alkalisoli TaxID=3028235 RepID=A0ABT5TA44_9RHOB|nr:sulfotransferase [Roseinatronobacter sp. HJB301]MDD7971978.1 sulfotransferase [Roseinatronobacter sp. HJB301]
MPIYKQAVNHNVTLGRWLKFQMRDALVKLLTRDKEIKINRAHPVFIVGCGHSGTTLLADRLGLHPHVHTIRQETNIFLPSRLRSAASDWLSHSLDLVSDIGKHVLIEKTPKHVHAIEDILRVCPQAVILGLSRNPLDNIGSLKRRFGAIDLCIDRWMIDNCALLDATEKGQVETIKYESLVSNYNYVIASVFDKIGVEPLDADWIEERAKKRELVPKNENQKIRYAEVSRQIENKIGFSASYLTNEEKDVILERTHSVSERLGYSKDFLNDLKGKNR